MLGDFFTKPLQGTQFMRMRSKILNLPSSSSTAVHRSVLKNVEKNDRSRSGSAKTTRSSTRLENTRLEGNKAVIGGRDGDAKL